MCGIVAVKGAHAGRRALSGLRELEYRGYDSAGMAVRDGGKLAVARAVGPLSALATRVAGRNDLLDPGSRMAIGHTRWATHGTVSVRNAHPLTDCANTIAVVHNGVLHNAPALRQELRSLGHRLRSTVDSEVIAHLVEDARRSGCGPLEAVRAAITRLEGSWAIAVLMDDVDAMVVARHGSPLLVRGSAEAFVVASDPVATAGVDGPLRSLADGDIVELGESWRWQGRDGTCRIPEALVERRQPSTVLPRPTAEACGQGRDGAEQTSTALEIAEQDAVTRRLVDEILTRRSGELGWRGLGLPAPDRVVVLGCGTSFHAAQIISRTLAVVAGVSAIAAIASEYDPLLSAPADLVIAISQSGETADVLDALDRVCAPVLAITNNAFSSLARRAESVIDCAAGYERGVAATKTLTAQVLSGAGLAIGAAHQIGRWESAHAAEMALKRLPEVFGAANAKGSPVTAAMARKLAAAPGWLFLGTGSGLPYAAEGALKLKEITYRWAQSYPAAELKHGPLALVEPGTPVVVVDNGSPRLAVAVAEVSARGGHVIRLGSRPRARAAEASENPPWGPIHVLPSLQHLAVDVATALDRNVDRPRNLAKSVTVS